MQNVFDVLQFDLIKEKLAKFATSEGGRKTVFSLSFLKEDQLKEELSIMAEVISIFNVNGTIGLGSSIDLEKPLYLASKGATLPIEQIYAVGRDLLTYLELKRYIVGLEDNYISRLVNKLDDNSSLATKINKIIAPDLSIFDNASPELKRIRTGILKTEKEIKSRLDGLVAKHAEYLSSTTLNLRNGHYVLPVLNSYKNVVKGIMLDVSSSGNTCFIEPEEIVILNNKIAQLKADEKAEINRLLAMLSSEIGQNADSLTELNKTIARIDFLQAKYLFGTSIHGHLGLLEKSGKLFLPGAFHPLLNTEKIVANDFIFNDDAKMIILSGPNAGGKSVAIKTLAMCVVMFKMALMLPCKEGAELPYFKHVYIDIGDSQSIEDNLSTFSGHISNIASFLPNIGGKDLVLLDEVGTGTSPREGEALALSIVNYLFKKHAYGFISSHFDALKQLALSKKGIINASMLFDEQSFKPLYILKMGLPGNSFGLTVAQSYGIDPLIIKDAQDYLDSKMDFSITASLNKLNKLNKEYELEKVALEKKEKELKRLENDLKNKQRMLNQKESTFREEMIKEKNDLIIQAKEDINKIYQIMDKKDLNFSEIIAAKKSLDELLEEEKEEVITFDEEVKEGDFVEVPEYDIEGRIMKISGNSATIQTVEGLSIQVATNKLRRTNEPEEKVSSGHIKVDSLGKTSLSLECNLIGMHYDEAKVELEAYLDKCRVKGFKRVRIIHGFGSGTLRKLTHEYLKNKDWVDHYELAGEYEGGSGATVVYLK